MAASIADKLKQLSQEDLTEIILQLSQENTGTKKIAHNFNGYA